MVYTNAPFPPGVIAVPMASSVGRYDAFYTSLDKTMVPVGTDVGKIISANVAFGLNLLIRQALRHPDFGWVWFQGDDHTWDQRLLLDLLVHDVDVVVPLVAMRFPPYPAVIFNTAKQRVPWSALPASGLWPLPEGYTMGQAGMLVKRRVLEALEAPWFRVGQEEPDALKEDVYFTRSIQRAGFTIHVDCDRVMGHIEPFEILPSKSLTGQWQPAIVASGGVETPHAGVKTAFFV